VTNHMHVLVLLAREPDLRLREIASRTGITERAAHRIVSDLVEEGYLLRERVGLRNHYVVHTEAALRDPLHSEHTVGEVIGVLNAEPPTVHDRPQADTKPAPPNGLEMFRNVFDGLPAGVAVWDATGRLLAANPAFCSLLGRSEQELRSTTFREYTHPDDIAGDDACVNQLVAGVRSVYTRQKRYIRKDGTVVWVQVHVTATANPMVEGPVLIGHAIETGDQRRHAQQLVEAEQRFRSAFDNAPIGLALVAPDGRFLKVNRALCDITGYTETALIRLTFQSVSHPEDLDADLAYVDEMLAGKRQTYQMEKRYRHADGHFVWVQLSVSLLRDPAQNPLYLISQIQDITERKHREQAAGGNAFDPVAA
jgi:PAS domain S-box-containing protein